MLIVYENGSEKEREGKRRKKNGGRMSFINPKWSLVDGCMERVGEGDRSGYQSLLVLLGFDF